MRLIRSPFLFVSSLSQLPFRKSCQSNLRDCYGVHSSVTNREERNSVGFGANIEPFRSMLHVTQVASCSPIGLAYFYV